MVLRRCPHADSEVMRYISGIHACLSYAAAGPERFAVAARTLYLDLSGLNMEDFTLTATPLPDRTAGHVSR